jgi:hypothetical protein
MRRDLALAAVLSLAVAGAAQAQPCLSSSDGLGGTTLSCPDGRTGYLHDEGAGAAGGMIGAQAFAGASASLAPPFGPAVGVPSAAYIPPPLPPIVSPPPPDPSPVAAVPPLTAAPGTTGLDLQHLQDRTARAPRGEAVSGRAP